MPDQNTLETLRKHNALIEKHRDASTGDGYFWSLCHKREGTKVRKCLKCGRGFRSDGASHRICAQCKPGRRVMIRAVSKGRA